MCPFHRVYSLKALRLLLSLTILLAITASAGAQETVHQWLTESLGPGQPKGSATAPVIMEEFSDFQCFYCGKFARETLPRLIKAYIDTGKVRLIYRHYAILGPDSERAAEASACAGLQGQFWPYHDRLFAIQGHRTFSPFHLLRIAQELGLDVDAFTSCLETGRFRAQVRAETRAAMALGLRGTPGFVINGRLLVGALPFALFQAVIEDALTTAVSRPRSAPLPARPPAISQPSR